MTMRSLLKMQLPCLRFRLIYPIFQGSNLIILRLYQLLIFLHPILIIFPYIEINILLGMGLNHMGGNIFITYFELNLLQLILEKFRILL